jgi:hypothetical protein
VFALFAALCAGMAWLLAPGGHALAPTVSELAAVEEKLAEGARLHRLAPGPPVTSVASFCGECHHSPPHPGRGVRTAFANEHASRMGCLLCHWSAANGPRPPPAWQVMSGSTTVLAVLPRERSSKAELERLRAAVTAVRRCFERGPACEQCHRPGGISSLARPGTSPAKLASLERLENYFTLAPGEKWYLPQTQ